MAVITWIWLKRDHLVNMQHSGHAVQYSFNKNTSWVYFCCQYIEQYMCYVLHFTRQWLHACMAIQLEYILKWFTINATNQLSIVQSAHSISIKGPINFVDFTMTLMYVNFFIPNLFMRTGSQIQIKFCAISCYSLNIRHAKVTSCMQYRSHYPIVMVMWSLVYLW